MHHVRGVKGPAGMGGPHCDHSPSSLICSHYPYQRLKIKNKDRESDGGQRDSLRQNMGKMTEGGKDKETAGYVGLRICPSDCHLPLLGGCRGVDASDVGSGLGREEGG